MSITQVALAIGVVILSFVSYSLGFTNGQADVRRSTVVTVGAPYYRGVHYGECAIIGGWQACAARREVNAK